MMNRKRLLKAIQNNQTVRIVNIDGFFMENFTVRQQLDFWDAIANLPNLEEIHISYFLGLGLESSALQCIACKALRLINLSIHDTNLLPGGDWNVSFKDHPALSVISITQLSISQPSSSEKETALDKLLSACLSAPNLRKLTIRMAQTQSNLLNHSTIHKLAQTTLKTLELRRVVLDDEALGHLMRLLTGTKTALAGSLRELVVECGEMLKVSGCASISEMLQSNSSLVHLELWGTCIDASGTKLITEALKTNRKLKVLHMSHVNIGWNEQQKFFEMLQYNYFLESIVLQQSLHDTMFLRTLDFFLKMNTTQIRRLMLNINANAEQILDKILVHSINLNYVYHLLRGNPDFIPHQFQ